MSPPSNTRSLLRFPPTLLIYVMPRGLGSFPKRFVPALGIGRLAQSYDDTPSMIIGGARGVSQSIALADGLLYRVDTPQVLLLKTKVT